MNSLSNAMSVTTKPLPDDHPLNNTKMMHAARLALKGYPVFRCRPNQKFGYDGWQAEATCEPVQVVMSFAADQDCNIGIFTDRLLVLDADMKPDKHGNPQNGYEVLEKLFEPHGGLPDTARTLTTTGGGHFIFRLPDGVRVQGSQNKLGKGVDVRSSGNLIVAPGSTIDGKAYTWVRNVEPLMAPDWLIELCGRAPAPGEADIKRERKPRKSLLAAEWVNQEALFRIKDWAPDVFSAGRWSGASYSVWPDALGRGCEERLSIHPNGIQDWGQDFGGRVGYTPIGTLQAFFTDITDDELVPVEEYGDEWKPLGTLSHDKAAQWLCDKLGLGDFDDLVEEDKTNADGFDGHEPPPIELESFDQLAERALEECGDPLVDGIIDRGAMSTWYGGPKSYKSFILINLALMVALGKHWAGRETHKGAVVYVALEGGRGVMKRLRALGAAHWQPGCAAVRAAQAAEPAQPSSPRLPGALLRRGLPTHRAEGGTDHHRHGGQGYGGRE